MDNGPEQRGLTCGLSIIHANHLEDLRQVAVRWIGANPLKPLENELFIVQSNGMAQWLKLALAENDGCGISASLEIQLPARFLWNAYRAVLGAEAIPRESPYDKVRLIWRLLRLLPGLLSDPRFAPLSRFLADDDDLRKRYQLACHLADLFDQYQVYRADWLEDWTRGEDCLRNAKGEPCELPESQSWQAELWRQVQADVPEKQRGTSRSALHRLFLKAAETLTQRPKGLPRRVIVFGICSLPRQALEALHVLARHSQVLLFVHNPCRHFWADIIEDRELLRIERARTRHKLKAQMPEEVDPDLLHQHANPLLAAWGKQGRDYIGLLYGYDEPETYRKNFAQIDLFDDVVAEGASGTLLQEVQQAVLDLTPLPGADGEKRFIAAEDQSITFQLAHSRQREVEILQDQLLLLFERIEGLKPRDVIVMTPDIVTYAPHIEAVFGNLQREDNRFIPFTIADSPERASIPVLMALEKLLRLSDSRMAASDLMDLLEVPAFRERFGLSEADLPRLHRWIEGAGIRWGLNAELREGFGLPPGLEQNTWLFGLRRMLLGYAVGAGDPWRGIEPYDEVGGLDAALVGPLAAILAQLEKHAKALGRPAAASQWCERIRSLADDCLLPTGSRDRLTFSRLEETLKSWEGACNDAKLTEPLTLPVVREAVLGAMNDASMSQRFLAGMVNFCTLMPMRAIPFKVVCLLGMNDGEYPRSRPPLDFDLMAGRYRPGDRSRREDDRYLFLEAMLSAREKLYISYIGRSVRDNGERMPSVLVGQLRDYLAAGWKVACDESPVSGEEIKDPQEGEAREKLLVVEETEGCDPEGNGALGKDEKGKGLSREAGEQDGLDRDGSPAGAKALSEEERLLDRLTCQHPLQPFSREYFKPRRPSGLFTYAHEWREVLDSAGTAHDEATAEVIPASGERAFPPAGAGTPSPEGDRTFPEVGGGIRPSAGEGAAPAMVEEALPAPQFEGGLQLTLLIRFLKNPVQSFFNQRLKVHFDETPITTQDQEPFALDMLSPFGLGDQLLKAGLAAEPSESKAAVLAAAERLRRTGELPLGGLGEMAAGVLAGPVLRMLEHHHGLCEQWPKGAQPVEIRLPVDVKGEGGGPLVLEDWLDGLHLMDLPDEAPRYARWEYYPKTIMARGKITRLSSLVGIWVKHLAGCAQGISLTSYLVGPDGVAELPPQEKERAVRWLTVIIDHWWQGLFLPLPVTAKSALPYQAALFGGSPKDSPEAKLKKASDAARKAYQGDGYKSDGEVGYSPYLERTYPDFDALAGAFGNRFETLAEALYAPLVQVLTEAR